MTEHKGVRNTRPPLPQVGHTTSHTRPMGHNSVRTKLSTGGGSRVDNGWREHAACIGAAPALFEPRRGSGAREAARQVATRFCLGCPVREQCNELADEDRLIGLFGGTWRIGATARTYRIYDLLDRPWMVPYLGSAA